MKYELNFLLENNLDSKPGEVDLHGLYVKEAIKYTEEALEKAQSRGDAEIRLIVGKGLHSDGHVAKIKPALEELMQNSSGDCSLKTGKSSLGFSPWSKVIHFLQRKDCTVRDQQSYEATRAAAKARQALVDECILKQREAERQGDAVMVEHYRKESEQHMIILNLLNAQASEWVFWDKNQNVAADTVELHGLRVKEALERGVNAAREAEAAGKTQLVLIVGRGSHSDRGVAVLRPALQEELKRLGYDVSLHRGNEDSIISRLDPPEVSRERILAINNAYSILQGKGTFPDETGDPHPEMDSARLKTRRAGRPYFDDVAGDERWKERTLVVFAVFTLIAFITQTTFTRLQVMKSTSTRRTSSSTPKCVESDEMLADPNVPPNP
ncbi:hypothetical protein ID866_5412 [Astraeus odoratus]|nr:hypothetical protein ID866_5412 [Astraeus odoratus]